MDEAELLLFTDDAEPTAAALALLAEHGFHDPPRAWRRLQALRRRATDLGVLDACLRRVFLGLGDAPNPDAALVSFERYLAQVADPTAASAALLAQPRAIEVLLKIFGGSQYLTETLLRHPEYLERLSQRQSLSEVNSREEFAAAALAAAARCATPLERWDALRRYQRGEILRIGVCDAFGLMDLRTVTVQLSLLADALIRACLTLLLSEHTGASTGANTEPNPEPKTEAAVPGRLPQPAASAQEGRAARGTAGFCVLALGKLGGEELNYSSDIDLLFLAESSAERWVPLAQRLIRALQMPTNEGFLYRIDMRLRPWGRSGALVSTVEGFLAYLRRDAELWERQALLKARVIAGDEALGERILAACQPIVFDVPPRQVLESVRASKARIEAALERSGRAWGEVKSGLGSLRDIEFITQALQLVHGAKIPQVRSANTLDGLIRLADWGLLPADEFRQLTSAYLLLRTIEHALQLMHNRAEHTLPADRRELAYLARRLDFPGPDEFVAHYERHVAAVRAIYERHIVGGGVVGAAAPPLGLPAALLQTGMPQFSPEQQQRHRQMLQAISPERPVSVAAELLEGPLWRVTVLGIDHPGDLSMICGLLFVYGCDILEGLVTTGEHPEVWPQFRPRGRGEQATPRDFVDVFTVRPPCESAEPEMWVNYQNDLLELMQLSRSGRKGEAQGRLAKRVAAALEGAPAALSLLSPVEVELDNDALPDVTVMHIRGEDTIGFLYELTNALALTGIQIVRMAIRTQGARVCDTLYITNAHDGAKLTAAARQHELRAAVVLIKHFTHLLPQSPNPEAALLHFRSFVSDLFRQPDWPETLSSLERPEVLGALAQLLGVSDFLWEDFLRLQSANLFPLLRDLTALQHRKSPRELTQELADLLTTASSRAALVERLNAFKDREMFRIDMRHILGHIPEFEQFSEELSDVAEVVVAAAVEWVQRHLRERYGLPRDAHGQPVALCVAALGKFGGRELGFASDIELLFIYASEGETDGPEKVSNALFFSRVVEQFTQTIQAPREGVFHVDLRLRPYGRAGQLAVSLAAFEQYFAPGGPAWPYERQALVKLRPVAGDAAFGRRVLQARDRVLFTGDACDVAALRAMRERQVRQLVRAGTFNVKLSPGGMVDLEYLVQMLQIRDGHRCPELRTPNTLAAADALRKCGTLTADDHRRLRIAYSFFRRLIDALRMVRGNAHDLTTPAPGTEEFEFLARRMGLPGQAAELHAHIEQQVRVVNELVRRYLPNGNGTANLA
jgi:glutamate-ammonia-ligase adenylyltransferase